jgi:hypothetical protein
MLSGAATQWNHMGSRLVNIEQTISLKTFPAQQIGTDRGLAKRLGWWLFSEIRGAAGADLTKKPDLPNDPVR